MMAREMSDFTGAEITDYLAAVASLASVDGHIDPSEREALLELCLLFGLDPERRARVLDCCENPPPDLSDILARLSESSLRYSLLTDLCAYAHTDGIVQDAEQEYIMDVAGALRVKPEHAQAIFRFTGLLYAALSDNQGQAGLEDVERAREELVRARVPLRPVRISGTVVGLEREGIPVGPGWD
ncbi:MAG TPA: TerB family tellurite resistance protein [Candidatus Nitrosotenuis sp.]|jgi:uncharacterized tellurite resistance protein B-like protein|nr:TerB family tellurite resistance protein [Candidatus Nitrosotenuis sp.]